jgi:hypothetical protein
MTQVSLEDLNRRAAIDAVHAEAAKIGADGDTLLDSNAFYTRVTALDPDSPGYRRQVAELVAGAAPRREAAPASPQPRAAAPQQPQAAQQWDRAKVNSSTAGQIAAAWDAGLLVDLGYSPRARR